MRVSIRREPAFRLTFNINFPGIAILRGYLEFLPAMEQQAAIFVFDTYENRRVCTFGDLLSVNLNELRRLTLQALLHIVHVYFHIH